MKEIECGNFFDRIDDLLEFPNDDVMCDNGVAFEYNEFPPVFGSENSRVFSAASNSRASDLSAQLSVPYEDIVQLEWLSTFMEESFAGGGLTIQKSLSQSTSSTKDSFCNPNQFRTSSPISVLESSSSNSNSASSKGTTLFTCHEKRARSKRPRPPTFNPFTHLISPMSSISETTHRNNASLSQSTFLKKKKIKILSQNQNPNANPTSQPLRKCMHCEITQTPQWRAGPMGPKTLCNACGVRYKSGRLFPEYRPAASPTFIPALHSNSHKKVLEMRTKSTEEKPEVMSERRCQQTELILESALLPSCM